MSIATATEPTAPLPHELRENFGKYNLSRCLLESLGRSDRRETGDPFLKPNGIEGEVSAEISRRSGRTPKGFYVPLSHVITCRDAGPRRGPQVERRALLDATAGAGAIATFLPRKMLIDVLRARMVVSALGATHETVSMGTLSLPRKSATAGVGWVGDGSAPASTNLTADTVPTTPRTVTGSTDLTRKYLRETWALGSDVAAEDLITSIGVEFDRAALNGSGTSNQPKGILQQTGLPIRALGVSGAALTYADVVGMEKSIGLANADSAVGASLGFVGTPAIRAALRLLERVATSGRFVWKDNDSIIGRTALATINMPSNLTKGTGTNLSAFIYGDWTSLVLAQWNAVDVLINPYTFSTSGIIRVSAFLDCDVALRHPESFVAVVDAIA
jgi:HK97 family phage major capsid protein